MNTVWIRRVAIVLGVLLLLLVAAAAVLIATFDANRYKGLAIDWMKAERQRTLVIDGPIELSVFPRLAIKVSKVRLSERARADEFVAIDEAALAVQMLPLLRKQLVVDRISARGVRAVYLRDAKGVRNIDDLIGASAPAPAAPTSPPRAAARPCTSTSARSSSRTCACACATRWPSSTATSRCSRSARVGWPTGPSHRCRCAPTCSWRSRSRCECALDGSTTLALDLDKSAVALRDMKVDLRLDGAGTKDLALDAQRRAWRGTAAPCAPGHSSSQLKRARFGTSTLSASSLEVKRLLFNASGQRLELDALEACTRRAPGRRPAVRRRSTGRAGGGLGIAEGQRAVGANQRQRTDRAVASFSPAHRAASSTPCDCPAVTLAVQGQMQQRKVDGTLRSDSGRCQPGAVALERST